MKVLILGFGFAAILAVLTAHAESTLSGIVDLRISSGAVAGDPIAFQFKLDGAFIGIKLEHLDPKPWVYSMKWDSRTVPDGTHILSGVLWFADGRQSAVHEEAISVRQKQPSAKPPVLVAKQHDAARQ